ncbi:unnamed protein product [Pleuronectes platessa]|uniref:Uncharacterized protein n=1 Tax=Pleuronectes platessa TaxID=8262 RepID=A0A9N7UHJ5_PLEPL|nr:unnamed protein product [Pleuronectes platessa]
MQPSADACSSYLAMPLSLSLSRFYFGAPGIPPTGSLHSLLARNLEQLSNPTGSAAMTTRSKPLLNDLVNDRLLYYRGNINQSHRLPALLCPVVTALQSAVVLREAANDGDAGRQGRKGEERPGVGAGES